MDLFIPLLRAFVVGGILCGIGQLLIDFTKLTPARILTGYVVTGVILGGIGVYQKLVDFVVEEHRFLYWALEIFWPKALGRQLPNRAC